MHNLTSFETISEALDISADVLNKGELEVCSPVDGHIIARIDADTPDNVAKKTALADDAFLAWRQIPAPRRGELIRLFGDELRKYKFGLGALVTLETGKIYQEGLGEVQEMIDICDFAVGLSRQLYGLTMPSERPGHKMAEYWHPAGVVGVITAFNFPVAVWSWNAALAFICGDSVVWKPSEKTPVTALVCQQLFKRALRHVDEAPANLLQVIIGGVKTGDRLIRDQRVPVISATGSTRMGRAVAPVVAQRLGRCILELGGNNGMIVTPSADLDLTVRAVLFSAVGTAGQRCTSLRRLIVHQDILDQLTMKLCQVYRQVPIGNPFTKGTLMGPLIDREAFEQMQQALAISENAGFRVHGGERIDIAGLEQGYYVNPAIVEADVQHEVIRTETFAPILYVIPYREFDEALTLHNDVPQGLSSCIFTQNLREAEWFLSVSGSDCGIANVNIGPSGAEIGGAFGGEKETGGGRESGSDAWKGYMRRCTATTNFSGALPLAQGIEFGV